MDCWQRGAEAQGYQLYFAVGMGIAVAACVFLLEIGRQILGERQVEVVSLAAVADVHAPLIIHASLPGFLMKISCRLFFESSEFLRQTRVRNLIGHAQ